MLMQMVDLWQQMELWPSRKRKKFSLIKVIQFMRTRLLEQDSKIKDVRKKKYLGWGVGGEMNKGEEICEIIQNTHTFPEISIPISSSTWLTISWLSSSSSEASKISSRVSLT